MSNRDIWTRAWRDSIGQVLTGAFALAALGFMCILAPTILFLVVPLAFLFGIFCGISFAHAHQMAICELVLMQQSETPEPPDSGLPPGLKGYYKQ